MHTYILYRYIYIYTYYIHVYINVHVYKGLPPVPPTPDDFFPTADYCKRPRQDRREIRSNETTNEPPQKKRTALEHSGNLGATCSHGQDYVAVGDRGRKEPAGKRMEYECPYCRVTIYSAVESGKVKAVGHCGQQFRVRNGVVARGFAHACPTCGQQIQSAKSIGRIKSTHKRPDGQTCPRTSWVVK